MPLLEKEYRNAARRLEDTQDELTDLHPDKCARTCARCVFDGAACCKALLFSGLTCFVFRGLFGMAACTCLHAGSQRQRH